MARKPAQKHQQEARRARRSQDTEEMQLQKAMEAEEGPLSPQAEFPRLETRQTVVRKGMVGTQDPSGVPDVILQAAAQRAFALPPPVQKRSPRERIFRCKYGGIYALQMTCPPPEKDRFGRDVTEPSRQIVFTNHEYRTENPDEIEYIETSRMYGVNFWDAELHAKMERRAVVENIKRSLLASEETMDLLKQELSSGDFDVLDALKHKAQRDRDLEEEAALAGDQDSPDSAPAG